ncbi:putative adipokinetic hormone corazonin-like 1 [Homarus americanus]|uniref:Putative adipokinetic hormone corazonin-like 1 n=1 Tax=Homarus americanus TaxID=6706 RepID=A0A8J5JG56_HOMAM|nr:putative adipokinetic hormone corazonin-like 1 [Homarus americanus]
MWPSSQSQLLESLSPPSAAATSSSPPPPAANNTRSCLFPHFEVMLAVMCLALAPTLAQITFSRSWVPQGKRSGGITGPLVTPGGGSDRGADPCKDVRLATLTQVASHLATRWMAPSISPRRCYSGSSTQTRTLWQGDEECLKQYSSSE